MFTCRRSVSGLIEIVISLAFLARNRFIVVPLHPPAVENERFASTKRLFWASCLKTLHLHFAVYPIAKTRSHVSGAGGRLGSPYDYSKIAVAKANALSFHHFLSIHFEAHASTSSCRLPRTISSSHRFHLPARERSGRTECKGCP